MSRNEHFAAGMFSGARQGVRYLGNGGRGILRLAEDDPEFGQQHLVESRAFRAVHPESVSYGEHAQPRRTDPTQWNGQMALLGMPKPTDPHVHRLRQANPHLANYDFKVHQRTKGGVQEPPHRVSVHDKQGNRVGLLKLGYVQESYEDYPGHQEVDELGVAPAHQRKGIAEAMYDLARMKGSRVVHSYERSESGEAFARRTGGPTMKRRAGHNRDDYLGLDANPHKV